jgi:AraC-like DNA-binding protein
VLAVQPKHYRIEALGNLELLHFPCVRDGYHKHMHEEYSVCFLHQGNVQTSYRGGTHISSVYSLTVMNPAELHAGRIEKDEVASYFSLYPTAEMMKQTVRDCFDTETLPYFGDPIVLDKRLVRKLQGFLRSVRSGSLELETHYLSFLAELIRGYADSKFFSPTTKDEPKVVKEIKDYFHANLGRDVSLGELANIVHLNRSYLTRIFKKATGLPPHAYFLQLKLGEAKRRLVRGETISQVALETGFADQSHFSRAFKTAFGLTPAQYAKAISP